MKDAGLVCTVSSWTPVVSKGEFTAVSLAVLNSSLWDVATNPNMRRPTIER